MIQEVVDVLKADPWVWNFIAVTAGMFIHTIKTCHTSGITMLDYWKKHKGRSATAIASVYSSYFALMLSNGEAGAGEFLAIGYMIDSLLNKAPESVKLQEIKAELAEYKCNHENRRGV